jgi:hypothetical protein
LGREVLFGVLLGLDYDGIVGGEVDVLDEDRARFVEVWLALEDGFGVQGDSGPAVLGDGVVGGGRHDGHAWGLGALGVERLRVGTQDDETQIMRISLL